MTKRHQKKYSHIGRKKQPVDAAFWEGRYEAKDTGWDQGAASPGLVDFLEKEKYIPGTVLVPGCGRGHDARALVKAGFKVTAIDVSDIAMRDAQKLAKSENLKNIQFRKTDFFKVSEKLKGSYEWLFEHTFFCAIDPSLRGKYVQTAARLLKKDGYLLGVFYNIQPESGPPFGTTREELVERFSPKFTLKLERVPRSFPNREGKELLMLWQRR